MQHLILKIKIKSFLVICFSLAMLLSANTRSEAVENPTGKLEPIAFNLDQAIHLALQFNRNLISSASSVESRNLSLSTDQSEFDLKIYPAARAGIDSQAETLSAGVTVEKKYPLGLRAAVSPRMVRSDGSYSGEVATALELPLLRGFGRMVNLDAVKRSRFAVRSAERAYYASQVNVVLETVAAFYDIIQQEALVKLYDEQIEKLRQHAANAKIKEKVGLATPIDIYRAEIKMKDAEERLIGARESLQSGKDRLKIVLSLPLERAIAVTADVSPEKVRIGEAEAVVLALENRIELEQAEDDILEARRSADIAEHNLLPQLDLVVTYDRFGISDEFAHSMRLNDDRWSLNLVSATDWARVSEKNSYQQSLIDVRNVRLRQDSLKDEITREVRRQLDVLRKSEERIDVRKQQIRQAEGKLALAKIQFNYGMADNFDVIEAETELQQAQADMVAVNTDYIVGTYRMRAIMGTLVAR